LFTETARPQKVKRPKKTMSPPPSDEDIGKRSRTSLDQDSPTGEDAPPVGESPLQATVPSADSPAMVITPPATASTTTN